VPGSAHIISSFVSYGVERRISKDAGRVRQGRGGAASPARSRKQRGGLRGLRADAGARRAVGADHAVMIAALLVHGVAPGAADDHRAAGLFWGFIASMYVGNVVLLALNLPMVGLLVQMLRIPYPTSTPASSCFCVLGVYAVNQSVVEVWIMVRRGSPATAAQARLRGGPGRARPGAGADAGDEPAPVASHVGRLVWILYDHPIARGMLSAAAVVLLLLGLKPLLTRRGDWRSRLGVG
jgi:hypothetical protein